MDNNKDLEPQWYVLHINTGYENVVEENLHNMIENNNLQDYIVDVKSLSKKNSAKKRKRSSKKRSSPTTCSLK